MNNSQLLANFSNASQNAKTSFLLSLTDHLRKTPLDQRWRHNLFNTEMLRAITKVAIHNDNPHLLPEFGIMYASLSLIEAALPHASDEEAKTILFTIKEHLPNAALYCEIGTLPACIKLIASKKPCILDHDLTKLVVKEMLMSGNELLERQGKESLSAIILNRPDMADIALAALPDADTAGRKPNAKQASRFIHELKDGHPIHACARVLPADEYIGRVALSMSNMPCP